MIQLNAIRRDGDIRFPRDRPREWFMRPLATRCSRPYLSGIRGPRGRFGTFSRKEPPPGRKKKQEDGSINSWPSVAFVILVFFPGSQGKTVE